jgi:two-component system response regulator WspF
MRVALVNDLKMALEALRRVVESMPDASVVWMAEDGSQALDKCQQDLPDLVLMDMIMPVMDGVEATRQIMNTCPCPILVTTASVTDNVSYVFEALGHGAVDAVNTPVLGTAGSLQGADDLIRKIRQVRQLRRPARTPLPSHETHSSSAPPIASRIPPLVAIGASTGGPQALRKTLATIGKPPHYAVLVVQHLDAIFVPGLAKWLSSESDLPVGIVEPNQRPRAGQVYLACSSDHLVLGAEGRMQYVEEPKDRIHRPSVDVLFASLCEHHVPPGVAVLLTGMGQDGANGLKSLLDHRWETIAQNESSSAVWGMPGAAVRMKAACQVLADSQIGEAIDRCMRARFPRPSTTPSQTREDLS